MGRLISDVWDSADRRTVRRFPAYVEVLYLTKEQVKTHVDRGLISKSEFEKYWSKTDVKHLEEVAVHLRKVDWPSFTAWVRTWGHAGGSTFTAGGYAVRCGGVNQHKDPLNVFFLEG